MSGIVERIARILEPQAWVSLGSTKDTLAYQNRRTSSMRKASLVLEEMLHPSEDMVLAGWEQISREPSPHAAEACWQAMLIAALD